MKESFEPRARDTARGPTVIVMAKAPVAGRSKTRLGRDIGAARAAYVSARLIERTMDAVMEGRNAGWWRASAAVDPAAALGRGVFRRADGVDVFPQARGDLGVRLLAAMRRASDGGPIIVIGADAPAISAVAIERGFRRLKACDVVFGPAEDGGFWLLGVARGALLPRSFEGVRWSTRHAMADATSRFRGRRIAYLDELADVDEAGDLSALGGGVRRVPQSAPSLFR